METLSLTINVKVNVLYFLIKCLSLKTATLQKNFLQCFKYDASTLICRFKKYFEDNRDVSKIAIKYIYIKLSCNKNLKRKIEMPYFKKIREDITLAYFSNIIDNEDLVLLYDLHKSRNLDITHTDFAKFDLENHNDDQCYVNFRFSKAHVYELRERLNLPEDILCYNNVPVDGVEALCTFLKRFSYPCRYVDMVPIFPRPIPQLSIICNHVTDKVYSDWGHVLSCAVMYF